MSTLHLLGIPHTRPWHSHCAFTGKVVRFPRMMTALGYSVHYYGIANDGDTIRATHNTELVSADEQVMLLGHDFSDHTRFHSEDANTGNALYRMFNHRLREALREHVQPGDIVCLPFGHAHSTAIHDHAGFNLESGIGYPQPFLPFRVYESFAWMHYHQGREQRNGSHYEWVVPNYYRIDEWPTTATPEDYVLFFGRLTDLKGIAVVTEMAKRRPDVRFIICGQGDPTPYLVAPNITYHKPVTGIDRAPLLGNARCVITPSLFTEPFCGVAVEAMLCGTPVLSTSFGAFTETIEQGVTGFRCHTLGDFVKALDTVDTLDRSYISNRARRQYSLSAVAPQYDRVFQQLSQLTADGWYSEHSAWIG